MIIHYLRLSEASSSLILLVRVETYIWAFGAKGGSSEEERNGFDTLALRKIAVPLTSSRKVHLVTS